MILGIVKKLLLMTEGQFYMVNRKLHYWWNTTVVARHPFQNPDMVVIFRPMTYHIPGPLTLPIMWNNIPLKDQSSTSLSHYTFLQLLKTEIIRGLWFRNISFLKQVLVFLKSHVEDIIMSIAIKGTCNPKLSDLQILSM